MRIVKRLGGYLLLLLVFLIPGLIASTMEATANDVGMFYVGALIWSVLGWLTYTTWPESRVKGYIALALTLLLPVAVAYNYGAQAVQMVIYFLITVAATAIAWLAIRIVATSEEIV